MQFKSAIAIVHAMACMHSVHKSCLRYLELKRWMHVKVYSTLLLVCTRRPRGISFNLHTYIYIPVHCRYSQSPSGAPGVYDGGSVSTHTHVVQPTNTAGDTPGQCGWEEGGGGGGGWGG